MEFSVAQKKNLLLQLLGKWMYVAETVNIPGVKMLTKKYVDSAYVNVTVLPDSKALKFFQSQKM